MCSACSHRSACVAPAACFRRLFPLSYSLPLHLPLHLPPPLSLSVSLSVSRSVSLYPPPTHPLSISCGAPACWTRPSRRGIHTKTLHTHQHNPPRAHTHTTPFAHAQRHHVPLPPHPSPRFPPSGSPAALRLDLKSTVRVSPSPTTPAPARAGPPTRRCSSGGCWRRGSPVTVTVSRQLLSGVTVRRPAAGDGRRGPRMAAAGRQ